MKDNVEKNIEQLADKMMKETALKSPSLNFTANIMAQVEILEQNEVTVYKPLISKQFFIGIFVFVIALSSFVFFTNTTESTGWFSGINFDALSNNKITEILANFKVSKTVVYSIIFFGGMLFIQIPLLKNYFDKRLSA